MTKHGLGGSMISALLILTSCNQHVRMETRYEAWFLVQNDSLVLVQRDSIISVPVKENSVLVSHLMQKAGKDTIRIEGYLLKTSYSVIREGEEVERTDLHYRLLDNRGQEIASLRLIDKDSTEQLDTNNGMQTITLTGNISKMPSVVTGRLGEIDSVQLRTIAVLKESVKKETFDMGTGKNVEEGKE